MLHPGLYRYLDIPDVAAIAAPRPMMLLDGETDPLFTAAGVAAAYAKMRAVWTSQRAGDQLSTRIWPGLGHVFAREMQQEAFAWLDRRPARPHRPAPGTGTSARSRSVTRWKPGYAGWLYVVRRRVTSTRYRGSYVRPPRDGVAGVAETVRG